MSRNAINTILSLLFFALSVVSFNLGYLENIKNYMFLDYRMSEAMKEIRESAYGMDADEVMEEIKAYWEAFPESEQKNALQFLINNDQSLILKNKSENGLIFSDEASQAIGKELSLFVVLFQTLSILFFGLSFTIHALKRKDSGEYESDRNANSIPGFWVSIGLLGTFVSLTIAFLNIGDLTNNDEIANLPYKLAMAFITSVMGIVMSQVITRFFLIPTHNENAREVDYLKESPEEVLYSLRNLTRDSVRATKNLMLAFQKSGERMNDSMEKNMDLMSKVLKSMDAGVEVKAAPVQTVQPAAGEGSIEAVQQNSSLALARLEYTLDMVTNNIRKTSESQLEHNREALKKQLDLMTEQAQQNAKELKEFKEAMLQSIKESEKTYNDAASLLLERTQEIVNSAEEHLNSITETIKQIVVNKNN